MVASIGASGRFRRFGAVIAVVASQWWAWGCGGLVLLAGLVSGPVRGRSLRSLLGRSPTPGATSADPVRPPQRRGPGFISAAESSGIAGARLPVVIAADLLVSLLEAGLPIGSALAALEEEAPGSSWADDAAAVELLEALQLADRTGIAPAAIVRAAAAEQRRRQAGARASAAQRLGVLGVLPVGLCLLPAFIVLTVVPLVLGLFGDLR